MIILINKDLANIIIRVLQHTCLLITKCTIRYTDRTYNRKAFITLAVYKLK